MRQSASAVGKRLVVFVFLIFWFAAAICPASTIDVSPPASGWATATLRAALEKARVAREAKPNEPITIRLASGEYRLDSPLILEPRDSGGPLAPLTIEGADDGSTRILGSIPVTSRAAKSEDFAGWPSPPRAADLIDLSSVALPAPLALVPRGAYLGSPTSRFEIFQGDARLRPSVWPRQGYQAGMPVRSDGKSPMARVQLSPEMARKWSGEPSLMVGGYWIADWAYESEPAVGVDAATDELLVSHLTTVLPLRSTAPVRVMNALSELDQPGHYVLDAKGKKAFVLPSDAGSNLYDLAVARELLVFIGARHITVQKLAFERTLGSPIRMENASNILLRDCLVRNSGDRGITVNGGSDVSIERCVVTDMAETGVVLGGGDRRLLTPSHHQVVDSIIANFAQDSPSYRPGVELQGVGNAVEGSYLHGAPHSAILVAGNDHYVTNTEITDVLRESNDAGAIYMGRDWTARGNVFADNYIHDIFDSAKIRRALVGIYLDDQFSGAKIENNVFCRITWPVQIGGGRDNVVTGNAFLNSGRAGIIFDDRGENKQRQMALTGELQTKLQGIPFRRGIWAERYPSLVSLPEDRMGAPVGNVVSSNLVVGSPEIEYGTTSSEAYLTPADTIREPAPSGSSESSAAEILSALATNNPAVAKMKLKVADRANALGGLLYAKAVERE